MKIVKVTICILDRGESFNNLIGHPIAFKHDIYVQETKKSNVYRVIKNRLGVFEND